MTNTEDLSAGQPTVSLVPPDEIRKALSTILQSAPFRSSMQIQKVLKFLVLETLAGRGEALKERNIGARLFGRPPDYDTNSDPVVRLRIAEVRKRLALYYQGALDQTVVINIPSGSFRAVFTWSARTQVQVATDPPIPSEPVQAPADALVPRIGTGITAPELTSSLPRFRFRSWGILIVAAAAMVIVAALYFSRPAEEQAFDNFWSPILGNSNTVLIGMGSNPIYELSNAGEDEYYKNHPKTRFTEMGLHTNLPLSPGDHIDSKFLNPATNIYLTIGDVGALSDIEYLLAQRHIKLDVRFVNDVSYGDVRQNPTILIGAHNNIWTLNMTENLRFGFQGHSTIVDRFSPQNQWTANADRSETYAIVARVMNAWNGKVVVIIGGIGYAGTRAGGDFIVNPQSIFKLAKSLPRGWETKNIEVVLHTTVKNQVPMSTEIVASYAW